MTLQALPGWAARLCLRVERFLRECLPRDPAGERFVLAVSGGLDSTALALVLRILQPRLGCELVCAHLDHGLRQDSAQDALHAEAFCRQLGLGCRVARADVRTLASQQHVGLEEAGRMARYAFFEDVRLETGAFAVCTAHHVDDLAEDQVLRLMRGAGWPALGGMPAWDEDRRLLRPLLLTQKAELGRLLEHAGHGWREDSSNASREFTRNRVRQDIVPVLVRENPHYLAAAAELWRQARADSGHWDALMAQSMACAPHKETVLAKTVLLAASQALRLRLYKRCLDACGPGQALAATLRQLDEAWERGTPGKAFSFPGGKRALIEPDGIRFLPAPKA